jgi:hypothetical protein
VCAPQSGSRASSRAWGSSVLLCVAGGLLVHLVRQMHLSCHSHVTPDSAQSGSGSSNDMLTAPVVLTCADLCADLCCVLCAVCCAAVPLQLLWAEGGVKRFYRGFTPCLIRAVPANGAMLLTVDKITNWLNSRT